MDNEKMTFWQSHRPSTRRLVQLYAALLYNAHLKGFIEGEIYTGKTKYACVPGFNCYSCPGAVGACPLGAIQNALASSGHRAGWYVLGIIMLYGVILGRTICGWLCPLGLVQELLHKIPTLKIPKSRVTRALSWLKYLILAVFVVALPLWYGLEHDIPLPGFCKYICPAGTAEGAVGLLSNPANAGKFSMLGILFTRKFIIMIIIGLACIFCYRSFCRFLCPLGAIFGLFNRFNLIGVKVDTSRCNHCGACVRSCGMDVRHVGDHECINCAKCMDVCHQEAISFKAGNLTLMAPEGGCANDTPEAPAKRKRLGRILWGAALAVLCFALLWYNVLDPSIKKTPAAASTSAVTEPAPAQESVEAEAGEDEAVKAEAGEKEAPEAEADGSEAVKAEADGSEAAKVEADENEAVKSEAGEKEAPEAEADGSEAVRVEADGNEAEKVEAGETEEPKSEASQTKEEEGDTPQAESQEPETADDDTAEPEAAAAQSFESDAPIGKEPGNQLQDFTIQCMDGSEFHLADNRGKVVFLNLWATYCAPCVQELPFFSKLYEEHGDDIAMLAVHSSMVTDDPVEYVADKDWKMPLAIDTDDNLIWDIVGGSSTMPQTIVLNRKGEVVYNQTRSVTPEMLDELYAMADQ